MTIPRVEEMEEVDLILCPLNKAGRFMEPSVESTLQAIDGSSKRIIAIKPLAAGRLSPQEGLEYVSHRAPRADYPTPKSYMPSSIGQ